MPKLEYHPVDLEPVDTGAGMTELCLWWNTQLDTHYHIKVPEWNDEMEDLFLEDVFEYFLRQGGYMAHCKYCGNPFPYFQFGVKYKHCLNQDCVDKAAQDAHDCRDSTIKEKERERIAQEKAAIERAKKLKEEREREYKEAMEEPERTPGFGYVYLMKSANGLHKIGRSIDIENRLYSLNREIPVKVTVIHYFASVEYTKAEKLLHERYADQRVRYEWFELSPDDVSAIVDIKDHDLDAELMGIVDSFPF